MTVPGTLNATSGAPSGNPYPAHAPGAELPEERTEPCSCCGGDRGFEVVDGPDHERGGARTHWSTCSACDGSGVEVVEAYPLDEADLALTMEEALRLDDLKLEAMGAYDQ